MQRRVRGQLGVHAHVGHVDLRPHRAGDGVDGRATGSRWGLRGEVGDHGRGHLGRVGAHALLGHAVVLGRHDHRHAARVGPLTAEDAGQPHAQVLEHPQCPGRLGQLRLPLAGGRHGREVSRSNGRDQGLERRLLVCGHGNLVPDGKE